MTEAISTTPHTALPLPTRRHDPLDPPPEFDRIRQEQPATRLAFPDGHLGWLFTRYEDVRAGLADTRLSSHLPRRTSPVRITPLTEEDIEPFANDRSLINTDPPDHTRLRRLLTGQFTVRRMRALQPRIDQIVSDHIDAMARGPRPVDLVTVLALPVPSLVICELLGVPYTDRADFQRHSATLLDVTSTREEILTAIRSIREYMGELVRSKREHPTDDILTGLVHADAGGQPLTHDELVAIGVLLLIAGHETTANMIALGTLTLLRDRTRWEQLSAEPQLIPRAVEELLRYLSIVQFGLVRYAKERVELGGVVIQPGEYVVLHLPAANRDPDKFPDPHTLDFHRTNTHHLAFGHGVHQCLGQQLARVELTATFTRLTSRFPNLRLATPPDHVPMRDTMVVYGVRELLVDWDD